MAKCKQNPIYNNDCYQLSSFWKISNQNIICFFKKVTNICGSNEYSLYQYKPYHNPLFYVILPVSITTQEIGDQTGTRIGEYLHLIYDLFYVYFHLFYIK